MGKIGTKEVKVGGGSLPKTFIPGNHTCKINTMRLDRPAFAKNGEEMYYIVMDLETKPLGGAYEGFFIDKDDESKGRYLGQTGRLKTSQWPYKDSEYNGKKWDMVDEIIKFLKSVCIEMGSDWMDKADGKYDTIEEMVKAFNNDAPFKDIYFAWCIGGQQIQGDDGYPKYYMHLPKFSRGTKLFTLENDEADLLEYDKAIHLNIKGGTPVTVNTFGTDEDEDDNPLFAAPGADEDEDPFAPTEADGDEDPFAAD